MLVDLISFCSLDLTRYCAGTIAKVKVETEKQLSVHDTLEVEVSVCAFDEVNCPLSQSSSLFGLRCRL